MKTAENVRNLYYPDGDEDAKSLAEKEARRLSRENNIAVAVGPESAKPIKWFTDAFPGRSGRDSGRRGDNP